MKIHELKTLIGFLEATCAGVKPFEIRHDDRGFEVGDHLHLREWDSENGWGDLEAIVEVTYILRLRGLMDISSSWVAMAIRVLHVNRERRL